MLYQGFDIVLRILIILILILLLYQLSRLNIRFCSSKDSFIYIELKKKFVAQLDNFELYIMSRITVLLLLLFD